MKFGIFVLSEILFAVALLGFNSASVAESWLRGVWAGRRPSSAADMPEPRTRASTNA